MALALALGLVDEVDLDVADVGAAAQVVLAHQAVEVDRRGRAGVDLVVGHLGQLGKGLRHVVEHLRRVLDRRAFRHVQHHLEFRLVVERQHLHDDDLQDDEAEGEQYRERNSAEQPASPRPSGLALQERRNDPAKQTIEPVG